jgi:hypothetical protein
MLQVVLYLLNPMTPIPLLKPSITTELSDISPSRASFPTEPLARTIVIEMIEAMIKFRHLPLIAFANLLVACIVKYHEVYVFLFFTFCLCVLVRCVAFDQLIPESVFVRDTFSKASKYIIKLCC